MLLNRQSLRFFVVTLLLVPYALVVAQQLSPAELVKGVYGKYATVLKFSELPDDYTAVRISSTMGTLDASTPLMPLMLFSMQGGSDNFSAKYKMSQYCWSNGDTVKSLNREFLVTYKVDLNMMDLAPRRNPVMGGTAPDPQPATEPSLKINLVALDSIQSVSPCPEVSKKDLISAFGKETIATATLVSDGTLQASTLSNVKQIALGVIMYAGDYDDVLPYAQSTQAVKFVTYPYIKNAQIWKTLNPKGGQFRFNMGISGAEMTSVQEPASTVLIYETEAWSDGRRAVAFCDGHAKLVSSDAWALLVNRLKPAGIKAHGKPLPLNYGMDFEPDKNRSKGASATAPPPP